MEFIVKQAVQYIGDKIEDNEDATVHASAKIEEGTNGAVSSLSNSKYTYYIYNTQPPTIPIDEDLKLDRPVQAILIRMKNMYDSAVELLQLHESAKLRKIGIHPTTNIAKIVRIGENAYIGPLVYIDENVVIDSNTQISPHAAVLENTSVGSECIIYPHATVCRNRKISSHVILHAGSATGVDDFGSAPSKNGYDEIFQTGITTIEDSVEVDANTCVDHSAMGGAYVRKGVKLDDLVQIAHNTNIDERTVMSVRVSVAGSSKVGQQCMFGGQTGVADHVTIGNKAFLDAQSGVPGSIEDSQQLIDMPPMKERAYFCLQATFRKLPELRRETNNLKEKVE